MGLFGRVFGTGGQSDVIRELQVLKAEISRLPQKYSSGGFTFGTGSSTATEQIPTICAVIDDAVKALEKGLDVHNRPITKPQIVDGLKRLVAATRRPAFIGLVSAALNPTGVRELEGYMNQLEQIANKIR
jgi:hypothetical protein